MAGEVGCASLNVILIELNEFIFELAKSEIIRRRRPITGHNYELLWKDGSNQTTLTTSFNSQINSLRIRICNDHIRKRIKSTSTAQRINKLKWQWAVHFCRRTNDCCGRRWRTRTGKRSVLPRSPAHWTDDLKWSQMIAGRQGRPE